MAINFSEIIFLINKAIGFAELIDETWKNIQEHLEQEKDAKKREELLDACQKHDAAAIRALLYSMDKQ